MTKQRAVSAVVLARSVLSDRAARCVSCACSEQPPLQSLSWPAFSLGFVAAFECVCCVVLWRAEDWDDEDDGEWEAPTIPNPEYKGEWKPKM